MKQLLTLCLTLLFTNSAFAALATGDQAPAIDARASRNGEAFDYSLANALKTGPVVVYFYPSAYTGGCNVQAHTFAVNVERFAAAGATVVGVSLDSIERLNDFSKDPDYCAGQFPVASDPDGTIASAYGLRVGEARAGATDTRGVAIDHGFAERTTFVVGADGRIAAVVGGVAPDENVRQALAAVQKLGHHR
ncbi:MAG: peroxiredoxin [Pseudomonadales bacterium]|nr:peroxiredoxin [Pseudomonadales bacterium]MCP5183371.1 peroxiredoxin [Pseudomonadales bacterium]